MTGARAFFLSVLRDAASSVWDRPQRPVVEQDRAGSDLYAVRKVLRVKSPGDTEISDGNSVLPGLVRMTYRHMISFFTKFRHMPAGILPAVSMFFFHPDCTVGIGITPIQPQCHHRGSRTGMSPYITASRELHPTPKTHLMHLSIAPLFLFGKSFFCKFPVGRNTCILGVICL